MSMVLQEAKCPVCCASWDLQPPEFVVAGDVLECRHGCGPFKAGPTTVTCCMEDAHGMIEVPLQEP